MRILFNVILIASFFLFQACEKENETTSTLPTVEDLMKADRDISTFYSLVQKAQLQSFLNGPGPFTWIAPDNSACIRAGITPDSVVKMLPGTASFFVMYHLFNIKISSAEITALTSTNRTTQGGQSLWLSTDRTNYFINGASITKADMEGQNGIVHKVNGFFVPPQLKGNIQGMITSTGQHSTLIKALQKTGLWTALGTTTVFTILAPNDAAFIKAGITPEQIDLLSGAALTGFTSRMRYHLFNVRMFSSDFRNGFTPGTILGASRTIRVTNGGTDLTGSSIPAVTAKFVSTNSLGTNGVMHVTDNVLNP
jgi:uncharacterized surface protein with fasciclin (FAS1) repeats